MTRNHRYTGLCSTGGGRSFSNMYPRAPPGLCKVCTFNTAIRIPLTNALLPARLTVQFQSVLETFAPHETVFSFKEASELNESTLASACMLHTSAASLTSDSSSSLRKSRL